jgi:glucose-6-phosphate dehydrogenase assembly protein OpcA
VSTSTLPKADAAAIKAELAREKPHAMTMNLVVWNANAANRPWVVERAVAIGEKHPSRTIVLDATPNVNGAIVTTGDEHTSDQSARVEVGVAGLDHSALCELTSMLLVADIPTILWWSAPALGPDTPFAAVVKLADAVVVDSSSGDGDAQTIAELARFVAGHRGVVVRDLAWQRIHPWQDMVAHFFDDPHLREELFSIQRLRIVSGSEAEAFYLGGWLGSRLGWTASARGEFVDRKGAKVLFEHEQTGRPRRVRSVALQTPTTSYQGECLESDDLVVRVWAEGTYAHEERLFSLQCVDGASLVERAILESTADEIYETALRMVGTLVS